MRLIYFLTLFFCMSTTQVFPAAKTESKEQKIPLSTKPKGPPTIMRHPQIPAKAVQLLRAMVARFIRKPGSSPALDKTRTVVKYCDDGRLVTVFDHKAFVLLIIDIKHRTCTHTISLGYDPFLSSFSEDLSVMAFGSSASIDVYKKKGGNYSLAYTIPYSSWDGFACCMSANGTRLLFNNTKDDKCMLTVWDLVNNKQLCMIDNKADVVAISHDAQHIALLSPDESNVILLMNTDTGLITKKLSTYTAKGTPRPLDPCSTNLSFYFDGRLLICSCNGAFLGIWRCDDGSLAYSVENTPHESAENPDGEY